MYITGKVGIWPTGTNYVNNELIQIYLKINDKQFIFNNYADSEVKSLLEKCLKPIMSNIKVEQKGSWDNRKTAVSALNTYATKIGITAYTNHEYFILAVESNIIDANDDDVETETEIKFTEDLIPKELLKQVTEAELDSEL